MQLTIGRRIILGFAATLAITAGLGVFAYNRVSTIDTQVNTVVIDSLPGTYLSGQINSLAAEKYVKMLRHILSTDKAVKDALERELAEQTKSIGELMDKYGSTITTEEDRRIYEKCIDARKAQVALGEELMGLSRSNKQEEAATFAATRFAPAYEKFSEALTELADYNRNAGSHTGQLAAQAVSSGKVGILMGVAASILVGAGLAFLTSRAINKALTRLAGIIGGGSEQVAAASSQVSGSSQAIAQGASEQAAALEETTSALEEMSSMTRWSPYLFGSPQTLAWPWWTPIGTVAAFLVCIVGGAKKSEDVQSGSSSLTQNSGVMF